MRCFRSHVGSRAPTMFASVELRKANYDLRAANRKLKETQAQLMESQKMALQERLVAEIAHEIRNPLSFMANNLCFIEAWLEELDLEMQSRPSETTFKTKTKARTWLVEMREGLNCIDNLVLGLR